MNHWAQNENCHFLSGVFAFSFFSKFERVKHKKRRSRLAWWGNYEKMFTCLYPGRPNSNWEVGLTMHEKLRAHNLNLIPQISWSNQTILSQHIFRVLNFNLRDVSRLVSEGIRMADAPRDGLSLLRVCASKQTQGLAPRIPKHFSCARSKTEFKL
jgi:hypothetical protein